LTLGRGCVELRSILKLSNTEYKARVKFLRKVGIAPKVDLRRKLTPSQKGTVTRAFNPVSSQFIQFKLGRAIDFTPTTDKEILSTASRIWGTSNVTKSGFFVPRGSKMPANQRFVHVSIKEDKRGNKSIVRRIGRTVETYHTKPKGLTDKELKAFYEKVKLQKGAIGARYGFLIDKTISKSFSNFSKFVDRLNNYITAIQNGKKIDIVGAVSIHTL